MKYTSKTLSLLAIAAVAVCLVAVSYVSAKSSDTAEKISIGSLAKEKSGYDIVFPYETIAPSGLLDEPVDRWRCGQKIADRDGFKYGTLQIGDQCWMDQNLKTKTGPNGKLLTMGTATSQRDCISASNTRGTEADCQARGALYNWPTAKTICPKGWHLPTDFDFRPLESYLTDPGNDCIGNRGYWGALCGELTSPTGCFNAGTKLKEGGTSGFGWKLIGRRTVNSSLVSSFTDAGTKGYAWATSLNNGAYSCFVGGLPNGYPYQYAAVRSVSNTSAGVTRDMIALNYQGPFGHGPETDYSNYQALPVRCVKD